MPASAPSDAVGPPADAELSLGRFRSPRFWPTWAFLGALRVAALLPFRWQLALGRGLGRALARLMPRRRRIAAVNLALCFPERSEPARRALLAEHFEAFGISFFEMATGWFARSRVLERRVEIAGIEHLEAARAAGRGVLLVTAHFTCLDTCVGALQRLPGPFSGLYSPQRNAMLDVLIRRGRRRTLSRQLARDNVRGLIRALRDGHVVLYLPDQTYLGNQSLLLSFFGEPAVTNSAPPKLAQIAGARVMTYFFRRRPGVQGYTAEIRPFPDGYPAGDDDDDTRAIVGALENAIRAAPAQYLWTYKKFKARPAPYPDPYAE